jgi:Na+-translocating ferredoxin:NAD+ oxidoreductase RnfD subunit
MVLAGRIMLTLLAIFWLFIGGMSMAGGLESLDAESAVMVGLIMASAVAAALAWWKVSAGAVATLALGIAHLSFAYFAAGRNQLFAMLVSGGPFIVAGIFLAIGWKLPRKERPLREEEVSADSE